MIPSFLITFREGLEATLIVAIIVTYLRKIGKEELNKYAYIGSSAAVGVSLILGLVIQEIYGGLDEFASEIFEGLASITAVIVLTYMIFWMTENARSIRGELESEIDVAVIKEELYGIATLAFVAVFREGLETVLFLTAIFVQDAIGTIAGIVIGGGLVIILAILLMRGVYRMGIGRFFKISSVLLVIFAAGLAGYGVHELIEAGERTGLDLGFWSDKPFDINPPVNPDGIYPLLHENGLVGSILKALVGYDGDPEWLRIIVYLGYWVVIGYYLVRKYGAE